jgi:hypothetical protein
MVEDLRNARLPGDDHRHIIEHGLQGGDTKGSETLGMTYRSLLAYICSTSAPLRKPVK